MSKPRGGLSILDDADYISENGELKTYNTTKKEGGNCPVFLFNINQNEQFWAGVSFWRYITGICLVCGEKRKDITWWPYTINSLSPKGKKLFYNGTKPIGIIPCCVSCSSGITEKVIDDSDKLLQLNEFFQSEEYQRIANIYGFKQTYTTYVSYDKNDIMFFFKELQKIGLGGPLLLQPYDTDGFVWRENFEKHIKSIFSNNDNYDENHSIENLFSQKTRGNKSYIQHLAHVAEMRASETDDDPSTMYILFTKRSSSPSDPPMLHMLLIQVINLLEDIKANKINTKGRRIVLLGCAFKGGSIIGNYNSSGCSEENLGKGPWFGSAGLISFVKVLCGSINGNRLLKNVNDSIYIVSQTVDDSFISANDIDNIKNELGRSSSLPNSFPPVDEEYYNRIHLRFRNSGFNDESLKGTFPVDVTLHDIFQSDCYQQNNGPIPTNGNNIESIFGVDMRNVTRSPNDTQLEYVSNCFKEFAKNTLSSVNLFVYISLAHMVRRCYDIYFEKVKKKSLEGGRSGYDGEHYVDQDLPSKDLNEQRQLITKLIKENLEQGNFESFEFIQDESIYW